MYVLPIKNDLSPDFGYNITIDNVNLYLRFCWNTRCNCWVLNHYKEIDNDINFYGIRVKPFYNLLANLITEDQACSLKGALMVGLSEDGSDISYSSFGNEHSLFYLSETEYKIWSDIYGI